MRSLISAAIACSILTGCAVQPVSYIDWFVHDTEIYGVTQCTAPISFMVTAQEVITEFGVPSKTHYNNSEVDWTYTNSAMSSFDVVYFKFNNRRVVQTLCANKIK